MDEINRVARLMVDAEPAADLDARIRVRLDESSATVRVRNNWGSWQIAAGLAAAAALVTFVVLGSGGLASPKPEAKAGPEVLEFGGLEVLGPSLAAAGGEGGSPSRTLLPLRHSTGGSRAQVQATHTLSADELAWMDRRIPALDPVVALEVDQLSMKSIQPEPLAITPLIMTALPAEGGTTERRER